MNAEFIAIDKRLTNLESEYQTLRAENGALRADLAVVQAIQKGGAIAFKKTDAA